MYVPRRHSHRLPLPPGWVALGFLLLLGCQALLTHKRQLRPQCIIALRMPLLRKAEAEKLPFFTDLSALERLRLYNPLAALKPAIHWRHVSFTGSSLHDSLSRASLTKIVPLVRANVGDAEGVQVRFWEGSTYSNMIYLLDLMQHLRQPDYWAASDGQTSTFYIVSEWAFIPDEHYTRPLTFK